MKPYIHELWRVNDAASAMKIHRNKKCSQGTVKIIPKKNPSQCGKCLLTIINFCDPQSGITQCTVRLLKRQQDFMMNLIMRSQVLIKFIDNGILVKKLGEYSSMNHGMLPIQKWRLFIWQRIRIIKEGFKGYAKPLNTFVFVISNKHPGKR